MKEKIFCEKTLTIRINIIMTQLTLVPTNLDVLHQIIDTSINLETGKYYHLYNVAGESRTIFHDERDYLFFLERYHLYTGEMVSTLAYCLTPSEFHFVIKIITPDCLTLKSNIAAFLSGYNKALNNGGNRDGNSFLLTAEAKEIEEERHLFPLIAYLHQQPVRAKLVEQMEEWEYSSYAHLLGLKSDTVINNDFIHRHFSSIQAFKKYSEGMIYDVRKKQWM